MLKKNRAFNVGNVVCTLCLNCAQCIFPLHITVYVSSQSPSYRLKGVINVLSYRFFGSFSPGLASPQMETIMLRFRLPLDKSRLCSRLKSK